MLPLVASPLYSYEFPSRHRFPMQKFRHLVDHLREQGIAKNANLFRPGRARMDVLQQAHCPEYLARFVEGRLGDKEIRRLGLPWSTGLVARTLISPNGTLLTAQLALKHGVACHLAGGTHHAHYDFASGYCVLNDLAIAALTVVAQEKVKRVLIFDCDVHQGDGTAAILADSPNIVTCSIHCEKNFPARKQQSDIDIELPAGMQDTEYLDVVSSTLALALEQAQPDLVIYDAGVDIYQHDPLGLLDVSLGGIALRDSLVLESVIKKGIPVATVIGGGYDRDEKALARRHALVIEQAHRLFKS